MVNTADTADTASKAMIASGNPYVMAAGLALKFGANYLADRKENKSRNAEYEAMTNYLNSLDQKRAETEGKFKNYYEIGDQQFNQEANSALPELTQMKQDIVDQATEAQQNQNKQMQSQLAQTGVRGGQAATLLGRSTGELNRNLNYDVNKLGYDEARNRQDARLSYTSKKALLPYNTLTSAQWLYMPSDTEKAMMQSAINNKFAGTYNKEYSR